MLDIRLLGGFEVHLDGDAVEIASRPAQTLLAYLALHRGANHRREMLAGLLWPESNEESARSNLRHALWRLRKTLGDAAFDADRTSIGLALGEEALTDVQKLEEGTAASASEQELIEGLSAYGGELLPGFYEDWIVGERERFQVIFERGVERLLDMLVETERWREVQDWAQNWITRTRAPEHAYRALMRASAGLGDASGVAAAYRRGVEALQSDLGVEPARETVELFERLTSGGSPAASGEAGGDPTKETAVTLPEFLRQESEPGAVSFVGRSQELSQLEEGLEVALEGRSRIVFVTGDAGSGKTSLLHAFSRSAGAEHPDLAIAIGLCNAYSGIGDPYLPFRQTLAMFTGDVEKPLAEGAISREKARLLWRGMPRAVGALLDTAPDLIGPALSGEAVAARSSQADPDRSAWRRRLERLLEVRSTLRTPADIGQADLFEAYARFLKELSLTRPLLLILDDLQWADSASISLLFHLGRSLGDSRVMVVGSYRPSEVAGVHEGERHPLQGVVRELQRVHGEITLQLGQETEAEGRAFVDAFIDTEPNRLGAEFRGALFDHTGGHPLFTVELLRAMQARGDLVRDDRGRWIEAPELDWQRLPARVEAVIAERIERLETDLREALTVASVEGEDFTAQVVARVQQVEERRMLHNLSRELEKRHRLVREGSEIQLGRLRLSRYRFAHHLFQRFLYNDLGPGERRVLHGEIAAVLEDLFGDRADEAAVQLAYHYREAGIEAKALQYLILAGHKAKETFANREAIDYFTGALVLLPADDPDRFEVLAARAEIYRLIAQRQEHRADVDAMLELARRLDDRALLCDAHLALADLYIDTEHRQALRPAEEALEIARQIDDRVREALARSKLGYALWTNADYSRSRTELEAAASIFREMERPKEAAESMHTLSLALGQIGENEAALAAAEEALALSREVGDRRHEANALRRVAIALSNLNRDKEGLSIAEEALEASRELGDLIQVGMALNVVGIKHIRLRDHDLGVKYLRESLEAAKTSGATLGVEFASWNLIDLHYLSQGLLEDGLRFAEENVSWARDDWSAAVLGWHRARLQGHLGLFEEALEGVQVLLDEIERSGPQGHHVPDWVYAARYLTELGRFDQAREYAQLAIEKAEAWDPSILGYPQVFLTYVSSIEGDKRSLERSLENTRQSLETLRKKPIKEYFLDALSLSAGVHLFAGELQTALVYSMEAVELMQRIPEVLYPEAYLFTHSEALRALGRETEADDYLRRAHERLELVAGNIEDPDLRRSWLENPQVNCEIQAAWAERQGSNEAQ